jgi:hypothetical protein
MEEGDIRARHTVTRPTERERKEQSGCDVPPPLTVTRARPTKSERWLSRISNVARYVISVFNLVSGTVFPAVMPTLSA